MILSLRHQILAPYIYTFVTRTKGTCIKEKLINFLLSGYVAGSTLPFFLAHLTYICFLLKLDYYQALYDLGLFLLMYLILLPTYEIGYLINDLFSIKFEGERKTIRVVCERISFQIMIFWICVRLLISFILLWFFIPAIYKTQTFWILFLILLVFSIHNLIRGEIRTVTTFPILRLLRILFIFIPIIKTNIEWVLFALYSFSYIIPCLTIYVVRKFGEGEKVISKVLNINIWFLMSIIFTYTVLSILLLLLISFSYLLPVLNFMITILLYCLIAILINYLLERCSK